MCSSFMHICNTNALVVSCRTVGVGLQCTQSGITTTCCGYLLCRPLLFEIMSQQGDLFQIIKFHTHKEFVKLTYKNLTLFIFKPSGANQEVSSRISNDSLKLRMNTKIFLFFLY